MDGSLEKTFDLGERPVRAVAFSPDGKFLAVGYEQPPSKQMGGVVLFNLSTGQKAVEWAEETAWGVTAVAFSPDGTILATGNSEGEINLWRVPKD